MRSDLEMEDLFLYVNHDEDAEIYINGILAARLRGYTVNYVDEVISPEALSSLKRQGNAIAIHCHQTGGGQYIDAGFVIIR